MTKTFIYGVPHGFDFYEKDVNLNDYFKGFYISSRRGRRLIINRRDNGETIYSYLRYGLKEVDRQPLHSFFGMSLMVDNYKFCPNFKVLLEWFDYLFNKLVNEHNVIKKNEDGVYHYVIHKFEENSTDIEWLKSNLPNILTQTEQTEIINYDNSFIDGKAGQVVSFNQPVSEKRLLETFKKYRWISISSEITEKEEIHDGFTDPGTIELNYEELNGKLNEYNQQVLPIAIDISKGSYIDLKRMYDVVQEINKCLIKYLPTIDDPEEKEKFGGLEIKYESLESSIDTLLSKINSSTKPFKPQSPKQETQFCFSCKQEKPLSHFRSPDATKCNECEEHDRRINGISGKASKGYKTCISCGEKKSAQFFNIIGTDICNDCAKSQKKSSEGLVEKIGKKLISKEFLGLLMLLAITAGIAFAIVNFPGGFSTNKVNATNGSTTSSMQTGNSASEIKVDKDELDNLLSSSDFKAVYEYVKDKKDANNYRRTLKNAVQKYLMTILDTPQLSQEDVLEAFGEFYVEQFQLLDFISFGTKDKDNWEQFVKDYFYVWDLINKNKITPNEKEKGDAVFAKYPNLFPEDWLNLWANMKIDAPRSVAKAKPTDQSTGTASVTYISKDSKTITENITGHREVFIKPGTSVTFNYPNGYIKTKDEVSKKKKGLKDKRTFQPDSQIIVYCGELGITITPVKDRFNE